MDLSIALLLDAQQIVVQLAEETPVSLTPDGGLEEVVDEDTWVWLLLLQLGPGLTEDVLGVHHVLFPSLGPSGLLAHRGHLLRRDGGILNVDGTVLGLLGVLEDTGDCLANGREGSGAEGAVATVEQGNALGLEVHAEANHDAPVEERSRHDEGVGHAAGACFFLEGLLDSDFVLEDWDGSGLGVGGVTTELGGNKTLDVGFSGGLDEEKLAGDGGGAKGGDDGVLSFESVGEGLKGVVVDWSRGNGRGQGVAAALASEDGDCEASVDQLGEDGRANVASGLREDGCQPCTDG